MSVRASAHRKFSLTSGGRVGEDNLFRLGERGLVWFPSSLADGGLGGSRSGVSALDTTGASRSVYFLFRKITEPSGRILTKLRRKIEHRRHPPYSRGQARF